MQRSLTHMIAVRTRNHISLSALLYSNVFNNLKMSRDNTSVVMYAFSLALSAFISTGSLLLWHIYLVLTNQVSMLRSVCSFDIERFT